MHVLEKVSFECNYGIVLWPAVRQVLFTFVLCHACYCTTTKAYQWHPLTNCLENGDVYFHGSNMSRWWVFHFQRNAHNIIAVNTMSARNWDLIPALAMLENAGQVFLLEVGASL